jgi:hypothetical protein
VSRGEGGAFLSLRILARKRRKKRDVGMAQQKECSSVTLGMALVRAAEWSLLCGLIAISALHLSDARWRNLFPPDR